MADKYTNQEEARRQAAKRSFQAKDIKHTGISKTQRDKTGGDRRSANTDGILDLTLTFLTLHEVIEKIKADLASQNAVLLRKVDEQEETIRELEKQNRNTEVEQQSYKTTTGASFESENKKLKNKLDEVQVEYTKLEAAYKDLDVHAKERLKNAEGEINTLKSDQKSQEGTLQVLRQQVRDAEDTIKTQRFHTTTCASIESENKSLKNKLDEVKVECMKNEAAYKELDLLAKERLKKAEGEINTLKSDQKSQEGTLQALYQQVRDAEDAKQTALTRLSKQMGHQLTDGNPDITDLSDANRPTKLGERFAEVYDNQWTEALEVLQGSGNSNRDCVQKLLHILKNCNTYACRAAKDKLDELKKVLGISGMKFESDPSSQEKEVMSILKNLRKQMSAHILPDLIETFVTGIVTNMDKAVVAYAKDCFELCWYMAVCDPPMQLEFNGAGTFYKTLFRHFTATGNVIEYVVWPVVYLHIGGPVVCKGVAQPFPSSAINQGRQESRKSQREAWSETPSRSQDHYQHRDPIKPQYKYDGNQHSYNKHRETTGTPPASSLYPGGNQDTGECMFNNGAAGQPSAYTGTRFPSTATLNLVPTNTTPTYQQFVTETVMHDQSSQQLDQSATHSSAYTKEGFTQQLFTYTPTPPRYRDEYGNIKKVTETDLNNYVCYSGRWEERHVRSYLGKKTYEACRDFFTNIDTESNA